MSGIPRNYKGLNLQFDLDDVTRAFIHKGMMGESISFKQKDEKDEEVVVFGSRWDLDTWLNKLDSKISKALDDAAKIKKSAENQQAKADRDYETANARAEQEWTAKYEKWKSAYQLKCDQEVRQAQADRDEAQEIAENFRKQNENLMRINRENANAKRGLKPKKEHTGYVITTSKEKDYRWTEVIDADYKMSGGEMKWVARNKKDIERVQHEEKIWETTIQTPFTVDTDADTVDIEIQKQLFKYEGEGQGLIGRIGIRYMNWAKYEDLDHNDKNTVFKRSLQANYKSGYWEVIIQHTLPLGTVPAEMRAS